jgi:PPK2 family polyphosphate:nucleotide phosphotransferase
MPSYAFVPAKNNMANNNGNNLIRPIAGNGNVKLADIDTNDKCGFAGDKDGAPAALEKIRQRLIELQAVLYAEQKRKVLVVLQAMDTGGKDGVIRNVFSGINPQGVRVVGFKAPTTRELAHDYLWRVHAEAPAKGELTVFNRSHYEDVLITRVHGWCDDATAKRRFRHINEFETMMVDEGAVVLKFFLHISKAEQKKRLEDRLADPAKIWKFNVGDLAEREKWDDYQRVYQDAINATTSPVAPWYIVPADRKWVRDLAVASVLASTLEDLKMKFPAPGPGLDKIKISD